MSQRPASAPVAASTTAAGLRRASQRPRATGGSLRPGRRVARSSARDRSPERAARRNGRRGLLPGLVAARRPSGGGLTARGGSSAGSRTPGDSLRPGRTHRLRFPPRDPTGAVIRHRIAAAHHNEPPPTRPTAIPRSRALPLSRPGPAASRHVASEAAITGRHHRRHGRRARTCRSVRSCRDRGGGPERTGMAVLYVRRLRQPGGC